MKMRRKTLILVGVLGLIILIAQPFTIYYGGWEVRTHAVDASADGRPWVTTSPAQWQHDFDAPYSGAPDLIINTGLDPIHVNRYFSPSPNDEPAYDPIVKKTDEREYIYDVHLYKMDITLRVDGDLIKEEDAYHNSFTTECSYSNDRPGDGGSHDYRVQFEYEVTSWERFADEENSWAGIMSIFTYKPPTVGIQAYDVRDLPGGMEYDFHGSFTQVVHNPTPAQQGSKLNMWTIAGSTVSAKDPFTMSPDSTIPSKVLFELAVEFRSGAILGKDFWGNIEEIYILDPYVIFHIAFEVMAIHEFYLEAEPTTITQEPPVPSGTPGTEEYDKPWNERLGDMIRGIADLMPWKNWKMALILIAVAIGIVLLAKRSPQYKLAQRLGKD